MSAAQYVTLARHAVGASDQLQTLAEAMDNASFHADGWPPDKLRELANTLRGTAMRAAMAANDTGLLNELTGRVWIPLHERGTDA